jgi:hypothetical protein
VLVMCFVWHVRTPSVVVVAPVAVPVASMVVAPVAVAFTVIAVVLGVVSQVSVPLLGHRVVHKVEH